MASNRFVLKEGLVFAERYRIDGIVGRGGFGAVYRATDLLASRPIALKVLVTDVGGDDTDRRRFQREASLVMNLAHPNIVRLFEFGEDAMGRAFIAFELLEGCSLADALVRTGPLEFDRVVRMGIDVLRGLAAAHGLGIIHRDIKPQNVFLLNDEPWTKVLDFGVAKSVQGHDIAIPQLTISGQVVGTPQYMAPEQVRGETVLPCTDLYALALVLTEALTGEPVVRGDSLLSVYLTHIAPERTPLDPRVLQTPLGPILHRATSKIPAERYATANDMLTELERLPSDFKWRALVSQKAARIPIMPELRGRADAEQTRISNHAGVPRTSGTLVMEANDDYASKEAPARSGALPAFLSLHPGEASSSNARSRLPSHGTLLLSAEAEQPASLGIWALAASSKARPEWPLPSSNPSHATHFDPAPAVAAPTLALGPPSSSKKTLWTLVIGVFVLIALAVGAGSYLLFKAQ